MTLKELVAQVHAQHPEVRARDVASIIRATLQTMGQELATCDDGRLNYPGLGQFLVRQVQVTRQGQPTQVRRTTLIQSPARRHAPDAPDAAPATVA